MLMCFSACKEKGNDTVLTTDMSYNGEDSIVMVFGNKQKLNVVSDYEVSYKSSNENIVTCHSDGVLEAKSIGNATVSFNNGYHKKEINVDVILFEEPTFEFGCSSYRIKEIYGNPDYHFGDSIFIYGAHDPGYSKACWQMDFFFDENSYIQSDVYIRSNYEALVNKYLNDYFTFDSLFIANDSTSIYIYHNNPMPNIVCGKIYDYNQWGDLCLFYFNSGRKGDSGINIIPFINIE
ncbi:MAG: hypothetical protein ACI358_00290 [Candidatus Limimorpha sp.]